MVFDLPACIISEILQHTNMTDIANCARVSKRWSKITSENSIWERATADLGSKISLSSRQLHIHSIAQQPLSISGNAKPLFAQHYDKWNLLVIPDSLTSAQIEYVETRCCKEKRMYITQSDLQAVKQIAWITRYAFYWPAILSPLLALSFLLLLQLKLSQWDIQWSTVLAPLISLHVLFFVQSSVFLLIAHLSKELASFVGGLGSILNQMTTQNIFLLCLEMVCQIVFIVNLGTTLQSIDTQGMEQTSLHGIITPFLCALVSIAAMMLPQRTPTTEDNFIWPLSVSCFLVIGFLPFLLEPATTLWYLIFLPLIMATLFAFFLPFVFYPPDLKGSVQLLDTISFVDSILLAVGIYALDGFLLIHYYYAPLSYFLMFSVLNVGVLLSCPLLYSIFFQDTVTFELKNSQPLRKVYAM